MNDVTALIPRLLRAGSSIPSTMATLELRDAVRRFCKLERVWVETVTMDAVEDQQEYEFDLSSIVSAGPTPKVYQILQVKLSGATVDPRQYRLNRGDQSITFETATPSDVTDGLVFTLQVIPDDLGVEFPDDLLETYQDALVGGAASRLMKVPGRPYTDYSAAAAYEIDWKRGICQARISVENLGVTRDGSWVIDSANTGGLQG